MLTICLQLGGTDILAGVKVEVGSPLPSQPDRGYISVSVDWCAAPTTPNLRARCSCAGAMVTAPGSSDLSSEVALIIERSLRSSAIDW